MDQPGLAGISTVDNTEVSIMSDECFCTAGEVCDHCLPYRRELWTKTEDNVHGLISMLPRLYDEADKKISVANALFALVYCLLVTNHPEKRDRHLEEFILPKCIIDLYEVVKVFLESEPDCDHGGS
jgi:hypothetical protein